MVNAKQELLSHLALNKVELLCAKITLDQSNKYIFKEPKTEVYELKTGAAQKGFLKKLNFDYDAGYGTQQLYGTLWHKDGTWSTRCEYDGSEWWEHRKMPAIPENLK